MGCGRVRQFEVQGSCHKRDDVRLHNLRSQYLQPGVKCLALPVDKGFDWRLKIKFQGKPRGVELEAMMERGMRELTR